MYGSRKECGRWRALVGNAGAFAKLYQGVVLVDKQDAAASPVRRRVRTEPAEVLLRMMEGQEFSPSQKLLCYGCGRGVDLSWLRRKKLTVYGYDPHPPFGFSEMPKGRFDWVMLIFLLTRLKTDAQRRATVEKAYALVRPGGRLMLTSRHVWGHAREAGFEGGGAAESYLKHLLGGCDCARLELAPYAVEDRSVSLFAYKGGIYAPRNPVSWIERQEALAALCEGLQREPVIALDVETTLEEPRVLCTIQIGIPGKNYIIDALAMTDLAPVQGLLENAGIVKIIHNAFFEEQMFAQQGIRIHNIFDTLPLSRAKYKGDKSLEGGHKLGEVCERELGIFLDKQLQTSDWTVRPLSAAQQAYAAIDVEVLIDLYEVFQPPKIPENLSLFASEEVE